MDGLSGGSGGGGGHIMVYCSVCDGRHPPALCPRRGQAISPPPPPPTPQGNTPHQDTRTAIDTRDRNDIRGPGQRSQLQLGAQARCNTHGVVNAVPATRTPAQTAALNRANQQARAQLLEHQRQLKNLEGRANLLTRPLYQKMAEANSAMLNALRRGGPQQGPQMAQLQRQVARLEARAQALINKSASYQQQVVRKGLGLLEKVVGKQLAGLAAGPGGELLMTGLNVADTTLEVSAIAGEASIAVPTMATEAQVLMSEYQILLNALKAI